MEFSIHHIALSVSDIEKSIEFYSIFGFKKVFDWQSVDKPTRITHLKLGEVILELFCYSSPHPVPDFSKNAETDLPVLGTKHFALGVESLDSAKLLLTSKGYLPFSEPIKGRTGLDFFFIKDPDGI